MRLKRKRFCTETGSTYGAGFPIACEEKTLTKKSGKKKRNKEAIAVKRRKEEVKK